MRERHPLFPFYGSMFRRLRVPTRCGVVRFQVPVPRHVEGDFSFIFHSDSLADYTAMSYGGGIVVILYGVRPDVTYCIDSILVSFLRFLFRTAAVVTLLTVSESLSDTLLMLPAAEAPSWRSRVTSLSLSRSLPRRAPGVQSAPDELSVFAFNLVWTSSSACSYTR